MDAAPKKQPRCGGWNNSVFYSLTTKAATLQSLSLRSHLAGEEFLQTS